MLYGKHAVPRKPLSIILGATALALISTGALVGCAHGSVVRSAEDSREILASFEQAAGFIDRFEAEENRLPSREEYETWARTAPGDSRDLRIIEVETGPYQRAPGSDDAASDLGPVPEGAYYLTYWRGEWLEYYAGWSGQTTLPLRPRDYYVLGSPFLDVPAYVLAGLGLLFAARRAWPRSPELAV